MSEKNGFAFFEGQKNLFLDGVQFYAEAHTSPPPNYLLDLERTTSALGMRSVMRADRCTGRLLKILASTLRPRLAVDVGTFTGYSALCMAEGLPASSKLITCEIDAKYASFAQHFFLKSPYRELIDLRIGPALDTLLAIDEPIGLAFIDSHISQYFA